MRLLLVLLAILLVSTTALSQEATRLLEASKKSREQNELTASLEQAEAAVTLAPDDLECRENLAIALIYHASDSVYPGRGFGVHTPNIVARSTATLDQIEEIVRKGRRAQDLLESLPDPPESDVVFVDVDAYMAGLRGKIAAYIDFWRREKSGLFTNRADEEQVERIETDLRQLDKDVLDHWMAHRYRPVRERVRDRLTYENYLEILAKAAGQVFAGQNTGHLATCYEEIVTNILRIGSTLKTDPTDFRRFDELQEFNRLHAFFLRLAKSAAMQRERSQTKPDKNVDDAYDRTIFLMEKDPRQSFRLYAWAAKNNTVSSDGVSGDPKDAQRYYTALKERIREIPPGSPYFEYTILYSELERIINHCRKGEFDAGSGPIPSDPFTLALDIIALGTSRKEFASDAVVFLAQITEGAEFRAKRNEPLRPGYVPGDRPLYEKAVADHLRLTSSQAPGIATLVQERAIRCGFKSLEKWDLNDVPEKNITTIPSENVPWKEEVLILSGKAKGLDLRRPILHENNLYFFSLPDLSRIRLDRVDWRSLHLQRGKTNKSPVLEKPFGGRYSEIAAFNKFYGRMPGFVDDTGCYFGTRKKGVLVFPLDGRDPWPLMTDDDLPSPVVQAVGMIDDKVYLGLGEENEGSWLVAVDLKTKTMEILASSAGREGKAPFFNLSPAPRFTGFWADAKGNRLLMAVAGKQGQKFPGIWSIDGKTGEFSQWASLSFTPERMTLLPDGDRMLAFGYYGTYVIDLRNENKEESMNLLTCRDGEKLWDLGMRKHLQPALKGVHCIIGTEYRGFLWGVFVLPTQDKNEHPPFVWGRIASDGSEQFEPLPRPDGLPSEGFGTDSFFFPSPDQSGLFVSDGAALIYLRFGEP